MKESKDPFDRMILDDLEREADEIRRNVAAANLPPMTNEQKERIRENIQKEIDAREVQKICEQLPKEYQEALKIGMETIEKENRKSGKDNETEATKVRADKETEELKAGADKETEEGELSAGTDEKKHRFRRKGYLSRVAAAVVIVLLAGGIGVTSFGGPERVMEIVKSKVGTREVEKINSNEENLVIKEENEEQAYQKIKDELGIDPVRIVIRPKEFKFGWAKIENNAQISEMLYRYRGENIFFVINASQSSNSWGTNVDDKEIKKYTRKIKGVKFQVKEFETVKSKERRYAARFEYGGTGYYLMGVMPRRDFNNILKNLHFFEK